MFEGNDISVFAGPMVTVLGTSLQNRDLLKFFMNQLGGNWFRDGRILLSESHPVSLENKKSVPHDVKVRYAYYASDPLETGSTLASGGLGTTGVKPTYLITIKILEQILM
jgi:hypothetical protein